MLLNHILLGALWVLYCVLHSVLASLSVKNFFQKRWGKGYKHYRLAYTVFAAVGLSALIWFQFSVHSWRLFQSNFWTYAVGVAVTALGLIFMSVCIKKYFLNLSGLRSLVQERQNTSLEITGIHRHVRHPLYSATFLFIWGLLVLFPTVSLLITNFIITVYTLIGIKLEEEKLVVEFGERYKRYKTEVPKLLPAFRLGETILPGRRQNARVRR